ncbi:hypothetical protein P885DRAFT_62436 [Corynascus similis CBS 632.67]
MADTYWDPANLLQITDDYTAPRIQCLARAQCDRKIRCPESLSSSETAAVMDEVQRMAANPPTKVTHKDLDKLAKLCLCRNSHSSQWRQISHDWRSVVARAAKHHERSTRACIDSGSGQCAKLLVERKNCLKMLGVQDVDADLSVELSNYLSSRAETDSKMSELQGDLAAARTSICTLEDCLRDLETELNRTRAREIELIKERLEANWRIEEIRQAEHARLAGMLKLVDAAKNNRARLESAIRGLRDELGSTICALEKERAKTKSLDESVNELKRQLAEATEAGTRAHRTTEEEIDVKRLAEDKMDLEHRLSEATEELNSTRRLWEMEKAKATSLREKQEDWECRLLNAYAEGDRLLAEEKNKNQGLKKAKEDLERRLREVDLCSDRLHLEQQTKIKVLSSIKHELRLRLSEARATSAAEANRFKRNYDSLAKSHAVAVERARRLQTSLDSARDRVQALKDERLSLESQLRQCKADTSPLRATNECLRNEIADLKSQIRTLEEALSNRRWRSRFRTLVNPCKPDTATGGPDSAVMLNL